MVNGYLIVFYGNDITLAPRATFKGLKLKHLDDFEDKWRILNQVRLKVYAISSVQVYKFNKIIGFSAKIPPLCDILLLQHARQPKECFRNVTLFLACNYKYYGCKGSVLGEVRPSIEGFSKPNSNRLASNPPA